MVFPRFLGLVKGSSFGLTIGWRNHLKPKRFFKVYTSIIVDNIKITHVINENRNWKIRELGEMLPKQIIGKIICSQLPLTDIQDKIYMENSVLISVKTTTWANNDKIPFHPEINC